MNKLLFRFGLLALVTFAPAAICAGFDFGSCLAPPLRCGGGLRCCPDDYRGKPAPCVPCISKAGCCDDYCIKPAPCAPCVRPCTTCDDYCRKPMPCISRAPWQFLKCPLPQGCGAVTDACGGCGAAAGASCGCGG